MKMHERFDFTEGQLDEHIVKVVKCSYCTA